jgi:hypothetical protein
VKVYKGSRGIAPLILNLSARWRVVADITPRPFYHREIDPVPTEEKPGCETQSRSARFGDEKNFLHLPGFKVRSDQPDYAIAARMNFSPN